MSGALADRRWVSVAAQIALGVAVVYAVYRLSLFFLAQDVLVAPGDRAFFPAKQRVLVLDGQASAAALSDRTWSTVNPSAHSYAPLRRSLNRRGGAQFTYMFWLYLGDASRENVAGKTLLLRGDPQPYQYSVLRGGSVERTVDADVLVRCPRIRFGRGFDELIVEVNTVEDPGTAVTFASDESPGDATLRKNLLKLTRGKWVLYTVTIEDRAAVNDFEDGVLVRLYVNDVLYRSEPLPGRALRQNNGDLHVLPLLGGAKTIRDGRVGDVAYYNYAVPAAEVEAVYRRGPPKRLAEDAENRASWSSPLYLSEFNKLDVYNS